LLSNCYKRKCLYLCTWLLLSIFTEVFKTTCLWYMLGQVWGCCTLELGLNPGGKLFSHWLFQGINPNIVFSFFFRNCGVLFEIDILINKCSLFRCNIDCIGRLCILSVTIPDMHICWFFLNKTSIFAKENKILMIIIVMNTTLLTIKLNLTTSTYQQIKCKFI
jgi:hypothetical protein